MSVELLIDCGFYRKGDIVTVYEYYKSRWDYTSGEVEIMLPDGAIMQLVVGEYKFI